MMRSRGIRQNFIEGSCAPPPTLVVSIPLHPLHMMRSRGIRQRIFRLATEGDWKARYSILIGDSQDVPGDCEGEGEGKRGDVPGDLDI